MYFMKLWEYKFNCMYYVVQIINFLGITWVRVRLQAKSIIGKFIGCGHIELYYNS